MTRSEQKYNKAVKMLVEEYCKAQENVWVCKPMAYSLYQIWKWFDTNEKSRLPQAESEVTNMIEVTSGTALVNMKNWNYTRGKYPMCEEERDVVMPVLQRDRKKPMKKYDQGGACPECGNSVANIDRFCRWCGQRLED